MRDFKYNHQYRAKHPLLGWGDHEGGYFYFPELKLRVQASSGGGWDHVSVFNFDRTPTFEEMEFIKRRFFEDAECVMQIHPPLNDYVSVCTNCLHLWRPQKQDIPRPPQWMV